MNDKLNKLNHIDLLRGVAIILVVITHVSLTAININETTRFILSLGRIGVQLFFVLSAYTLCLSMSSRKENSIWIFYVRRYFRIAPLYYFGIITYFIVTKVPLLNQDGPLSHSEVYSLKNIISNVFFFHGFIPQANNSIVPGGWSIATEMLFYLMFPLLFSFYNKIKEKKIFYIIPIISLIIAFSYTSFAFQLYGDKVFEDHFFYGFIVNQLPVFLVGISYFYIEKKYNFHFKKQWSLVVFAILFTFSMYLLFKWTRNISVAIFLSSMSFCFLFDYFRRSKFNLGLLARIGQLSFSIYIFHFLFAYPLSFKLSSLLIEMLNPYIILALNFIVTIVLSYIFAIASESLIEKQGINLGKKIIQKFK